MHRRKFVYALSVIILVAAAAFTRFYALDQDSLWLDEAVSLHYSGVATQLEFNGVFFEWFPDPHPPLYYWLLHFWTVLFGDSELAVRSLSAVFGIAVILATFFIVKRSLGVGLAFLTAAILCAHPVLLYYSQEARSYALMTLLVVVSSYAFALMLSRRGWRYPALYALSAAALIYTHYLGFLPLALHGLAGSVYAWRERDVLFKMAAAYALIGLIYTPWWPNFIGHLHAGPPALAAPTLTDGTGAFQALVGLVYPEWDLRLGDPFLRLLPWGSIPTMVLSYGAVLLLFIGIQSTIDRNDKLSKIALSLALTPFLIFLISVLGGPVFNVRQSAPYVPFIALLLALGIYLPAQALFRCFIAKRDRLMGTLFIGSILALGAALVFANVMNARNLYRVELKSDWRKVARDMSALPPEFPIFVYKGFFAEPFEYYYRGEAEIVRLPPLSREAPLKDALRRGLRNCPPGYALIVKAPASERARLLEIPVHTPTSQWNVVDVQLYVFITRGRC